MSELTKSPSNNYPLVVAPDMGSFQDGIEKFQSKNAPYSRGGGTQEMLDLGEACIEYIGKYNPEQDAFKPSAVMVSSGEAANHIVFRALRDRDGGNVVCSKQLFGTTKSDIQDTLNYEGVGVNWVDPCDTQAFIDASDEKTTMWFVEAVSNPVGRVPDFKKLYDEAQKRQIPLVVDATLSAGMKNYSGFEYADFITVSLTKQAGNGNNENIAGTILVKNDFNFPITAERFPEFNRYYTNAETGNVDLPEDPFGTICTKIGLLEGNGVIAPKVADSILNELPELENRVARMSDNADMLTSLFNSNSDVVKQVRVAGLNTDPENDARANEYLGQPHFVLLVDLIGDFKAAEAFIDSGEVYHGVALGQAITAVCNPASSTARAYTDEQRTKMGFGKGTLRISVGAEDPEELKASISRALEAVRTPKADMV